MDEISQDIIIKASEGDADAFELIYKTYSKAVLNVAFRMVDNMADAEEVTQQVFLTIYQKLDKFQFQSSMKTWIYRIAVNTAINYGRGVSKERDRTVEYREGFHSQSSVGEMEMFIKREDRAEMINSFLRVLTPDQRACIVLRSIEGMSYQKIAETLKININTVRSRLKRAREQLLVLRKKVVNNEL
ncbi:MAG: sigma-70 family RNA polymerase sigma factor [Nitrospira sp.]|nr:sigma-70 family RNA polymerase sigma factor [Nitrospira sp.]